MSRVLDRRRDVDLAREPAEPGAEDDRRHRARARSARARRRAAALHGAPVDARVRVRRGRRDGGHDRSFLRRRAAGERARRRADGIALAARRRASTTAGACSAALDLGELSLDHHAQLREVVRGAPLQLAMCVLETADLAAAALEDALALGARLAQDQLRLALGLLADLAAQLLRATRARRSAPCRARGTREAARGSPSPSRRAPESARVSRSSSSATCSRNCSTRSGS